MGLKRGKTVEYIISFMETYGYGAMFIAMVLENANIPIPSEIVLGFAGYLIAQGVFDLHTTMVVGILAGIVGSILSYWMGEYGKTVIVNVIEVKSAATNAQLVAEDIARQLENRVTFRRAMKQCMRNAMSPRDRATVPAKGIKAMCSGRLGGADIARVESYHEGTIPLQTLRADIDYGFAEAATTYGRIGVKVWVYKGEVLKSAKNAQKKEGGNK